MAKIRDEMEGISLPSAHVIPEFASEDEEREWWATHDTSALPGKKSSCAPRGGRSAWPARTVRTDQETLDRPKRLVDERGADYQEIAPRWLQKRLSQEVAAS